MNEHNGISVDLLSNYILVMLEMILDDVVENHVASGHSQKSHGRKGRGRSGGGGGGGRGEDMQAISDKQQRSNNKQYLKRTFDLEKGDFAKDHKLNDQGLAKVKEKIPDFTDADVDTIKGMDLFEQKQFIRDKMPGKKAVKVKEKAVPSKDKGKPDKPVSKEVGKETGKEISGPAAKPSSISHEGEPTEFGRSVWKEMGPEGTDDVDKVKKIGGMVREKIYADNPGLKEQIDGMNKKIVQRKQLDEKIIAKRKADGIPDLTERQQTRYAMLADPNYDNTTAVGKVLENDSKAVKKHYAWMVENQGLRDSRSDLVMEIRDASVKSGGVIAKATPKALSEIRTMGHKGEIQGTFTGGVAAKKSTKRSLDRVKKDKLPEDWLKSSSDANHIYGHQSRGVYNHETNTLKISGTKIAKHDATMIHELTHSRQHRSSGVWTEHKAKGWKRDKAGTLVPRTVITKTHHVTHKKGMAKVEDDFLKSRIKPGEKLVSIYGSGSDEVGYKDEFKEHYSGKVYRSGAREVATMGVEGVLSNKYFMVGDTDYMDVSLGILATQ